MSIDPLSDSVSLRDWTVTAQSGTGLCEAPEPAVTNAAGEATISGVRFLELQVESDVAGSCEWLVSAVSPAGQQVQVAPEEVNVSLPASDAEWETLPSSGFVAAFETQQTADEDYKEITNWGGATRRIDRFTPVGSPTRFQSYQSDCLTFINGDEQDLVFGGRSAEAAPCPAADDDKLAEQTSLSFTSVSGRKPLHAGANLLGAVTINKPGTWKNLERVQLRWESQIYEGGEPRIATQDVSTWFQFNLRNQNSESARFSTYAFNEGKFYQLGQGMLSRRAVLHASGADGSCPDAPIGAPILGNSVQMGQRGSYCMYANWFPAIEQFHAEVAIRAHALPVIAAPDRTIEVGDPFDALSGVTASDAEDGDLTGSVVLTGGVIDTVAPGAFELSYAVSDSHGATATATRKITVRNTAPTIRADDIRIYVYDSFHELDGVSAYDRQDGDITSNVVVTGEVDTSRPGVTTQELSVTDSHGATASTKRRVTVLEADSIILTDTDNDNDSVSVTAKSPQARQILAQTGAVPSEAHAVLLALGAITTGALVLSSRKRTTGRAFS